MNILVVGFGHTSKTATPTRARSGGETKLLNMLPVWQRLSQNHLTFLTSNAYACILRNEIPGICTLELHKIFDQSKLGFAWLSLKRITAVWSVRLSEKPDIIYCSSDLFFDVIPSVLVKRCNPKAKLISCVFLVSATPWRAFQTAGSLLSAVKAWAFYLLQIISFLFLRLSADGILVLNELDKQSLIQRGFPAEKIFITSGGVDIREIKLQSATPKRYDAVFLGRFHPQKGIADLPEIWRAVCHKLPGKKLLVCGGGDERMQKILGQQIQDYGLNAVITVKSQLSRKEVVDCLHSARVFVFPSHHESWGFVVAEAMACGLPVVAYMLPYMKSVFTSGIRSVPCYDREKFAEAICSLLSDSTEYKRMSAAAINQAKRYDWNHVAQREYGLFGDILKT